MEIKEVKGGFGTNDRETLLLAFSRPLVGLEA
jgi:hypothetical protein